MNYENYERYSKTPAKKIEQGNKLRASAQNFFPKSSKKESEYTFVMLNQSKNNLFGNNKNLQNNEINNNIYGQENDLNKINTSLEI